jgi:hypothetical protein
LPRFLSFPHNLSAFAPWRDKHPTPIAFRSQIIGAGREDFAAHYALVCLENLVVILQKHLPTFVFSVLFVINSPFDS